MPSGAEAVVKTLSALGVEQLFGYPGGTIMPVYDALLDSGLHHTLCRHEQGAAFAALGYARASGRVGVCLATSGPGATNLITALADAQMDSIPLVAITGQVPTAVMGTDAFQEVDLLGLSLGCTKHSFLVTDSGQLCKTLQQAFELACSGRPGPVLVDIPKDILQGEVGYRPPCHHYQCPEPVEAFPFDLAHTLLQQARQPVLYVGGGVAMAGAVAQLREFIKNTGMPSVTTLKGLGTVAPDTPDYLGMLGMHGQKAANLAVQQADLLLVVGARFDDRVTGQLDRFAPDARVIHLDIDYAELGKRRAVDIGYCGDLCRLLPKLSLPLTIEKWREICQALKDEHAYDYSDNHQDNSAILAPGFLRELSNRLPKNTVVSCDVGQHQMWVAQHMQFDAPENHLSSSGFGTMGFGLPAAIGAQHARPDDRVLAISGDGSFMMNVQELATIKRCQLPIKIIVMDNQRLGMVKQWQELFFAERYSETDLSDNPDFVRLASAFDIPGLHIHQAGQIDSALTQLLDTPGPFLLHVSVPAGENVWPLVPPGASNSEMMESVK